MKKLLILLMGLIPFSLIADQGQNFSALNDGFLGRMAATRDPGEIQFSLSPQFIGQKNNEKFITDIALEYGVTSRVEVGLKFPFMSEKGSVGPYGNGVYALYNIISKPHWDFLVTTGLEYMTLRESIDDEEEKHTFLRPQVQAQKLWKEYFMNLEMVYESKRIRTGQSDGHAGLITTLTAGLFQPSGRLFFELQQRSLEQEKGIVIGLGKSWLYKDSFQVALGGSYGTNSTLPQFRLSASLSWDIDLFKDRVTQLR